MTTITVLDNLWARVDGEAEDVETFLRFRPKGYQFAPSYQNNHWDGFISLCHHRQGEILFPAGLVELVSKQPWAARWDIHDRRTQPKFKHLYADQQLVPLDPHQEEAVSVAIESHQGIIQYPTGTGKGRIIGETIRRLGVRTLVLVDKLDLLRQLANEIQTCLGVPVGRIGGGTWDVLPCTISTFQTLARHIKDPETQSFLAEYDAVITDEGHHAEASTFANILEHIPAYYRLAYSATPFKSYTGKAENKGTYLRVQAWTGPPLATLSISEGVETGRIVTPDIFIAHGCTWEGKTINYKEEYQLGIVENQKRNDLITRLATIHRRDGGTVVLAERIDHVVELARRIDCEYVDGSIAPKVRSIMYDAFKQGELDCLVISKIADEALDLPNITTLILAGGGNAPHRQVQRVGRSMRASQGKTYATVWDFEDYGKYISSHYRRRRRTYLNEKAYIVVDLDVDKEIRAWTS